MAAARPRSAPAELTAKEREVLTLAADGLNRTERARRLGVSEETIHTHDKHIFRKLGVKGMTHAVATGFRRGMLA